MKEPVMWGELRLPIRRNTTIPRAVEHRNPLRACDLPPIMDVMDCLDAYRYALIQFVADWNRSNDPARLVVDPPAYDGDDWRLLPTVASVVHALAARQDVPVPGWVAAHQAPREWVLFAGHSRSFFWKRDKEKAPATCDHHQVFSTRAC